MAVAKNEDDLQEIRADDLAKKIKLEVPFQRSINTFLRKVNNDFANQYIAEGSVIDANDYKPELAAVLAINYNRIAKQFKFNVRESFDEKTSAQVNALIDTNITKFTRQVTDQKSDIILNTTNGEIRTQLAKSIEQLIEEEKELSNTNIGLTAKKRLNDRTQGRSTIISIAETQMEAESTKTIEENTLVEQSVVLGGIALAQRLKDVWQTTLDERTRQGHAMANGQEKLPNQSFIVNGELLKYPGDPSGRADNIIGCRCSKVAKVF